MALLSKPPGLFVVSEQSSVGVEPQTLANPVGKDRGRRDRGWLGSLVPFSLPATLSSATCWLPLGELLNLSELRIKSGLVTALLMTAPTPPQCPRPVRSIS